MLRRGSSVALSRSRRENQLRSFIPARENHLSAVKGDICSASTRFQPDMEGNTYQSLSMFRGR